MKPNHGASGSNDLGLHTEPLSEDRPHNNNNGIQEITASGPQQQQGRSGSFSEKEKQPENPKGGEQIPAVDAGNHTTKDDEKSSSQLESKTEFQAINANTDAMAGECRLSRTHSSHVSDPEGLSHLGSRMSTDAEGNTYPEGGWEAYLVVFGGFWALFGGFGLVNAIGTFQAWISKNQLKDYNDSTISWIFGVYVFFLFFGGIQIGPIFDAKGPRYLILAGSILTVASMLLIGVCTEYWHFMIVFSFMGGLGSSLVFTPSIAAPSHFFFRLRGRATGIASAGGSMGGIVFPLMMQDLFPRIGFAWTTRAVALVCFATLSIGLLLVKSRLPKKRATKENILPDLKILLEPQFLCTTLGVFFIEWGLFVPLTFISSYALAHGVPEALSYQLLALVNVGSFFGRWIPGYISDYTGRFNTMIVTVLMCLLSTACLWLPAGDNVAMLVSYSLIFGFASGSNIGLTPVCVGQVCKTEHYGRYYATAYTIVSFGTLTGTPIAGAILTLNGGDYHGLITWTTCCYVAGLVSFWAAKVLKHGWNPFIIY